MPSFTNSAGGVLATDGMKHIYIVFLLLAALAINYTHRGGWEDVRPPGDDPTYVESAYDYWHKGAHPGAITWSPVYVQMMSPFVGMLGKKTGYQVWRFAIFAGVTLMAYAALTQMFGTVWFGAALALFSQLFLLPYLAPFLQTVICLLYLLCLYLLAYQTRFIGLVFGLLLNGIFISGALGFVLLSFATLCLIFIPRMVMDRRFWFQVMAGLICFVAVLHNFSYDISRYSEEAAQRGRAGLYHQLSLYIVSSGRSEPYLAPDEADPRQYYSTEYERHLKAIDRYYLAKFGETENELRATRHDARWPLFLLDWPWMMERDPELMRGYIVDDLRALRDSLLGSFQTINPFSAYRLDDYKVTDRASFVSRAVFNIGSVALLLFILILPYLAGHLRTKLVQLPGQPSRIQALFLLSTLAALVPLMLVKPLPIYFPPFTPAYLVGLGVLGRLVLLSLPRVRPA
ncbi:MAG: hypothetical protein HY850_06855 [Betaproteobacteria bacterium]|nr:hypothetical protein [Betaproteobacteria bacterium]